MTSSGTLLRYLPVVPGVQAYVANKGPEPRLSGQDVCALLVDQEGTLWVGKESGGLEYLEPGKKRFGRVVHDPREMRSLSNDSIECMVERRNGEIWISTVPGKINILGPTTLTFRHIDPRPGWEGAESRTATTLYEDPQGTLWIGHSAGVDTVGAGSTTIVPCVIWPDDVMARVGYVTAIRTDSQGDVWIGTSRGGLLRQSLATKGGRWYRHDPADSSSLGSDRVSAVLEDREGRIWITTLAGLSLLDRSNGYFGTTSGALAAVSCWKPPSSGDLNRRVTLGLSKTAGGTSC